MAAKHNKKFLVGIFDEEEILIAAVKKIRNLGIKIHDVYTPYPVHDLEHYLGYKRTRLAKAAFMFGATGTFLALWMQTYMLGAAWPMDVGGKDHLAYPDFVPVTFEATVLLAALGMVGTFLVSNGLGPGKKALMFDPRSTDDKFVMAIDLDKNTSFTQEEIEKVLIDCKVSEKPKEKEVEL
ncbi:MAG: DUF3341 domain-containing protein [Microscillaceae bacterium]|nr:DUF3341 domain-containing protein [Microscillaceae bacterium]